MRVFLAGDILGILTEAFNLNFPSILFIIIGIAGFLLAGYRVYISMIPPEILHEPNLAINFIEGNEYQYTIMPLSENEQYFWDNDDKRELLSKTWIADIETKTVVPECLLTINFRITNMASLECRILSIKGGQQGYLLADRILGLLTSVHFDINGIEDLSYPIILKKKDEIAPFSINGRLNTKNITPAQLASRLALISHETRFTFHVAVEVQSLNGKITSFESSLNVSLYPLKEIYVTHWQNIKRDELLKIANI